MKKMRLNILGITLIALLMGIFAAQEAEAGVRVSVTLQTPNARVHVGNTPYVHYLGFTRGILPMRVNQRYKVNTQDTMIARRMARYTGVQARTLINLRSRGYSWMEIGRWLDLPQPVVRAAMNQHTWERLLRSGRSFVRYGNGTIPQHRIMYVDAGGYDGFNGEFDDD